MSNHAGSYMLNKMLQLMEQRGVFEKMGREATQQLVLDIVKISDRYDCNPGEILEDIDERLGICPHCIAVRPVVHDGWCASCLVLRPLRKRLGDLDRAVEAQIETLSAQRLEQLDEALRNFKSRADLDAWLQAQR